MTAVETPFQVATDDAGRIRQLTLFGEPLLDEAAPCKSELWVNGLPLELRAHVDPNDPTRKLNHLKGERFVDHFSGWGLVLAREMGLRKGLKHSCFGIQSLI